MDATSDDAANSLVPENNYLPPDKPTAHYCSENGTFCWTNRWHFPLFLFSLIISTAILCVHEILIMSSAEPRVAWGTWLTDRNSKSIKICSFVWRVNEILFTKKCHCDSLANVIIPILTQPSANPSVDIRFPLESYPIISEL